MERTQSYNAIPSDIKRGQKPASSPKNYSDPTTPQEGVTGVGSSERPKSAAELWQAGRRQTPLRPSAADLWTSGRPSAGAGGATGIPLMGLLKANLEVPKNMRFIRVISRACAIRSDRPKKRPGKRSSGRAIK